MNKLDKEIQKGTRVLYEYDCVTGVNSNAWYPILYYEYKHLPQTRCLPPTQTLPHSPVSCGRSGLLLVSQWSCTQWHLSSPGKSSWRCSPCGKLLFWSACHGRRCVNTKGRKQFISADSMHNEFHWMQFNQWSSCIDINWVEQRIASGLSVPGQMSLWIISL